MNISKALSISLVLKTKYFYYLVFSNILTPFFSLTKHPNQHPFVRTISGIFSRREYEEWMEGWDPPGFSANDYLHDSGIFRSVVQCPQD